MNYFIQDTHINGWVVVDEDTNILTEPMSYKEALAIAKEKTRASKLNLLNRLCQITTDENSTDEQINEILDELNMGNLK